MRKSTNNREHYDCVVIVCSLDVVHVTWCLAPSSTTYSRQFWLVSGIDEEEEEDQSLKLALRQPWR